MKSRHLEISTMQADQIGPFILLSCIFIVISYTMKKLEKAFNDTHKKKIPRKKRGISITFTFKDIQPLEPQLRKPPQEADDQS